MKERIYKSHKRYFLYALLVLMLSMLVPVKARADWQTVNGKTYYYKNGTKLTGFQKIGKYTYYFDANGVRKTKWLELTEGDTTYRYYFNKKNGRMYTGRKKIASQYYLFGADGRLLYGLHTVASGKTYYAKSNGVLARNEWVNGYYFQNNCTMAVNTYVNGTYVDANGRASGTAYEGLIKEGSYTYYYSGNEKQTGFITVDGNLYYFDPLSGGAAKTGGWFTVGNYKYYAGTNGVLKTNGWIKKKYLNNAGVMLTGWQTINGKRYYFKKNGNYASGWTTIDSKKYYFTKGVLHTSEWIKKTYYVGEDGARASGATKVGKDLYYFDPKTGKVKKGLIKEGSLRYYAKADGKLYRSTFIYGAKYRYYASADGSLLKGLQEINGSLYYFNKKTGRMSRAKKVKVDGFYYYFQKDGKAVRGAWKKIKKKYYYFGNDGKMAVNTVVDGYQVGPTGARGKKANGTTGWQTVNGVTYYYLNGTIATGWQTVEGSTYYFQTDGAMVTGIQTIDSKKYYFYPTGILASSVTIAVGDKEYTINAAGVVTAEATIDVAGTTTGSEIAKYALNFVGNKYVYGGTSLTEGADCSGFIMTLFANYNIKLLRVADDQRKGPSAAQIKAGYKKAVAVTAADIQPGDVVFYGTSNYASHCGLYIGNGQIVHASNSQAYPAGGIKISPWNYATPIAIVRYWS